MKRIYLDHAATTPLMPEAAEAMKPWLEGQFGNPSSLHLEGRRAKEAIDEAREAFSSAFGCLFGEVVFTSSGTEAANLAIVGAALGSKNGRKRVLLGAAEHHCVLYTREVLERLGFVVELIPVTHSGQVLASTVEEMLGDDVLLVSVMHANNELGTVNDVGSIGALVKGVGALFHVDAVQTFPGEWVVKDFSADLVNVSAHKFYGPKAVGALYVKAGTSMKPLAWGGGQEREMRAGTENVAGLVGAAVALRGFKVESRGDLEGIRGVFEEILEGVGVWTVEKGVERLPGHSHLRLPGVDAEVALIRLDRAGISASSGAACSAGSLEPSHVLMACGYSEKEAREGLRFTFGRGNTVEEAREVGAIVRREIEGILRAKG